MAPSSFIIAASATAYANSLDEISYRNLLKSSSPLFIVLSIWCVLFVLTATVLFFYPQEVYGVPNVYDNCTPYSAKQVYMIKLYFGPASTKYNSRTSYIMMDLMDEKKLFVTRLAVDPIWMNSYRTSRVVYNSKKIAQVAKFQLNRDKPLRELGHIRISHDCYLPPTSYITVYTVEIRDLLSNRVTRFPIHDQIVALGPDRKSTEQVYEGHSTLAIKDEISPRESRHSITPSEGTTFISFYANIFVIVTLGLGLMLPWFRLGTLKTSIINAVTSSLICLAITTTAIQVFHGVVKYNYAKNHGVGVWHPIYSTFMAVISVSSILIGAVGAVIGTMLTHRELIVNWIVTLVLGLGLFLTAYLPLLLCVGHKRGYVDFFRGKASEQMQTKPSSLLGKIQIEGKAPPKKVNSSMVAEH